MLFPNISVDKIIKMALEEDLGHGDLTTEYLINPLTKGKARIWAKEAGVVAGLPVAKRVFEILGDVVFQSEVVDGDVVQRGTTLAYVEGKAQVLLSGERVALNFLQRLSGISAKTRELVDKVKPYKARLVDTRKTTPMLRILERYAVRLGGGFNHRFCLDDAILIKDNHIQAVGGIDKALELAKKKCNHNTKITVEVTNLEEAKEALSGGADIILLDNMSPALMADAVKMINSRALVEASGNINEDNIQAVAATGVDIISLGMLTHSIKSMDISMDFI